MRITLTGNESRVKPVEIILTDGSAGWRKTQAIAICAKLWPRAFASSFSRATFASLSAVICSGRRKPCGFEAREPAGMPPRHPVQPPIG
jgi:hypothetical protein